MVTFEALITKKDKIAVVGVNGAGKSTLMKVLCGQYVADIAVLIGVQLTKRRSHFIYPSRSTSDANVSGMGIQVPRKGVIVHRNQSD